MDFLVIFMKLNAKEWSSDILRVSLCRILFIERRLCVVYELNFQVFKFPEVPVCKHLMQI